ncbi:MAG: hypothetical protein ACTTHG_03735 [Treponemataceae bacterium]
MSKNIILAGKDYSKNSHLQSVAESAGLNAFVTLPYNHDQKEGYKPESGAWNRGSPISAHTLIVSAENKFKKIDALALFFDTASFDQLFSGETIEDFTRATDDLILSYAYLTTETLKRFEQKGFGKLFFILQSLPSAADLIKNPPKTRSMNFEKAGTIASMAQASFKSYAESIAVKNFKTTGCFVYLLEVEPSVTEKQLVDWISRKMDEENVVYKHQKNSLIWQNLEEKTRSIFGFKK